MISVVMLHWKRTENTKRIVQALRGIGAVDDIIIWNNNPKIQLEALGDVRVLNASEDFGLVTRLAAALLARNEAVLTQDDDLLLPEETVLGLYRAWQEEPEVIHTLDGRDPTPENTYARYLKVPADQRSVRADMVLTRCSLFARSHAADFFQKAAYLYGEETAGPVGNGEDIILSYVARAAAGGKRHKVHKLPRTELPAPHPIHGRAGHWKLRTEIMRRCREHFGL